MFLLSSDYWEIRNTEGKGRGVFAKKDIPAGTVIGDYIGKVIPVTDEDKYDTGSDFYLMYLTDDVSLHPDFREIGIHIINHSCTPNCWMYTYNGHTLYFALRHIFAGEELTVDYMLDPLDEECAPCTDMCKCGSIICRGTMHLFPEKSEKWLEFGEHEEGTLDESTIKIGENLPPLSSYPENIEDHPIYTMFGYPEVEPLVKNDTRLPTTQELRAALRETGKRLFFPKIHILVAGVSDDLVILDTRRVI